MFAKIMSVHRGEESLAETFWLWLVSPVVLIFVLADLIQSNSLAFFELSRRTESVSILGLQFDRSFSVTLATLRVLLVVLVFFFAIGVVRSARTANSRVWTLFGTVGGILICVAVSAVVLKMEFRRESPDQGQIGYIVRKLNSQFPQPLGEWGTWQRLTYSNQVLSARFEIDRSKADGLDWDKVRASFAKLACTMWDEQFTDSPLRRFEGDFYSGTTLFQSINITRSDCR